MEVVTAQERAEEHHQKGHVVRDALYGTSKFHLTAEGGMETLCGRKAESVGGFATFGDRAEFDQNAPHYLCKRCLSRDRD